jgi:hypothetical protein
MLSGFWQLKPGGLIIVGQPFCVCAWTGVTDTLATRVAVRIAIAIKTTEINLFII